MGFLTKKCPLKHGTLIVEVKGAGTYVAPECALQLSGPATKKASTKALHTFKDLKPGSYNLGINPKAVTHELYALLTWKTATDQDAKASTQLKPGYGHNQPVAIAASKTTHVVCEFEPFAELKVVVRKIKFDAQDRRTEENLDGVTVSLAPDTTNSRPLASLSEQTATQQGSGQKLARFPNVRPGSYNVKVVISGALANDFKQPADQNGVALDGGKSKDLVFDLMPIEGSLSVEVKRKDNRALSQAPKFELRGPTPRDGTVDAGSGKVEIKHLKPGPYTLTLKPQSQEEKFEVIRTNPADSNASITVSADQQAKAEYQLKQKRVQFIGYYINTGQYRGTDNPGNFTDDAPTVLNGKTAKVKAAEHDIVNRCKFMTQAVRDAYDTDKVARDDEDVLKVFMAPEFYFRGAQGAYPLESVHNVMKTMRQETDNPKYKDWLFVFGSALAYLDQVQRPGKLIEAGAGLVFLKTKSTAAIPPGANLSVGSDPRNLKPHRIIAFGNASDVPTPPYKQHFWMYVDGLAATLRAGIPPHLVVFLNSTVVFPAECYNYSSTDWGLVEHEGPTAISNGWGIEQTGVAGFGVVDSPYEISCVGSKRSTWFTSQITGFKKGDAVNLTDTDSTEAFNVAYVAKGGPAPPPPRDGSKPLREVVIYKETISSVDFQTNDKPRFYDPAHHKINIHGKTDRVVVPTTGADDVLATRPNLSGAKFKWKDRKNKDHEVRISEINLSGLGGGSVFTLDDITFGLEVCLDHGEKRLKKFYANHALPGDPKVQVQLIPSCGMSIGAPCCVSEGIIFNVDAWHCAAKKNGGGADVDPVAVKVLETVPGGLRIQDYFDPQMCIEPVDGLPAGTEIDGYLLLEDGKTRLHLIKGKFVQLSKGVSFFKSDTAKWVQTTGSPPLNGIYGTQFFTADASLGGRLVTAGTPPADARLLLRSPLASVKGYFRSESDEVTSQLGYIVVYPPLPLPPKEVC